MARECTRQLTAAQNVPAGSCEAAMRAEVAKMLAAMTPVASNPPPAYSERLAAASVRNSSLRESDLDFLDQALSV